MAMAIAGADLARGAARGGARSHGNRALVPDREGGPIAGSPRGHPIVTDPAGLPSTSSRHDGAGPLRCLPPVVSRSVYKASRWSLRRSVASIRRAAPRRRLRTGWSRRPASVDVPSTWSGFYRIFYRAASARGSNGQFWVACGAAQRACELGSLRKSEVLRRRSRRRSSGRKPEHHPRESTPAK